LAIARFYPGCPDTPAFEVPGVAMEHSVVAIAIPLGHEQARAIGAGHARA
jgi:hypothetical protein